MTRKGKVSEKSKANLKPFVKGDPRINRNGRPKSFDQLRELFQQIASEEVENYDGKKVTRAEAIGMIMASDKRLMREFLEFAYGKVPLSQIVDITSGGKPLNWKDFINNDDDGKTDNSETTDK